MLYDIHFLNNQFVYGFEKGENAGPGTYGTITSQRKFTNEKELKALFKFS